MISSNKTAYVEKRFLSETGELISDILEITDLKGLLLMVDVEKAFAYVDHQFFINVLDTFGFDKILVTWIKILLKS